MLYNSFSFLLFFPIVAISFFVLPHRVRQWYLLLVSYLFYMNWNPTYALFLGFVTLVTYYGTKQIVSKKDRKRTDRGGLTVILLFTFAGLFVFKYLNFINRGNMGSAREYRMQNGGTTFGFTSSDGYLILYFSGLWICN